MSDLTLPAPGGSPFDAIKRSRPNGTEYWSARDLMPLLGYERWERFADAIGRARAAAEAQGNEVEDLFRAAAKKSSGGRPAEDVELARFACYLVAMNGDPRKGEVAAAQSYFAVRTREAETADPAIEGPELMARALLEATETIKRSDAARAEAERRANALEAPAFAWSHMAASDGDYAVGDAAKILSRDTAITTGRDRLFAALAELGWIYRHRAKRTGWRAYQAHIENGRLTEKANRPFLNERTGDMELPPPTVRVTAKGLAELHKRLGGTGQMELTA